MTLRVLFLDIDGVLNSADYLKANPGAFDRSRPDTPLSELDPEACGRLHALLLVTGAKLVISSTWRFRLSLERLSELLRLRGVTAPIIGRTPSLRVRFSETPGRGNEIRAWLDANPEVHSYAVVDDDSDMNTVFHRFVQTTWEHGLQREHVLRLVRTLMRPRRFVAGQHVHVYGVHTESTTNGALVDLNAFAESYSLGTVLNPEIKLSTRDKTPTGALVELQESGLVLRVPYAMMTEVFPSWQQLTYGFERTANHEQGDPDPGGLLSHATRDARAHPRRVGGTPHDAEDDSAARQQAGSAGQPQATRADEGDLGGRHRSVLSSDEQATGAPPVLSDDAHVHAWSPATEHPGIYLCVCGATGWRCNNGPERGKVVAHKKARTLSESQAVHVTSAGEKRHGKRGPGGW